MKLKCVVVADPKPSAAELVANQCERLAETRLVASSASEVVELVERAHPELAVISLELTGMPPKELVERLLRMKSDLLVVATYRELSVPRMEALAKVGVEDFVPHPADVLHIFRAASRRFQVPFRRHDRFAVAIDIVRADGVTIGRTIDISEGGLAVGLHHPLKAGESVLIDLPLPDAPKPLRVRCNILNVEGTPPSAITAHMQFVRLWGPEYQRLMAYLQMLAKTNATRGS